MRGGTVAVHAGQFQFCEAALFGVPLAGSLILFFVASAAAQSGAARAFI